MIQQNRSVIMESLKYQWTTIKNSPFEIIDKHYIVKSIKISRQEKMTNFSIHQFSLHKIVTIKRKDNSRYNIQVKNTIVLKINAVIILNTTDKIQNRKQCVETLPTRNVKQANKTFRKRSDK